MFDTHSCFRKVNLKLAITRLQLLKQKKSNLNNNARREIAQLLAQGAEDTARIKVESIIREDYLLEAYEVLELFCELMLARLDGLKMISVSFAFYESLFLCGIRFLSLFIVLFRLVCLSLCTSC
jgi:hypothetical protein